MTTTGRLPMVKPWPDQGDNHAKRGNSRRRHRRPRYRRIDKYLGLGDQPKHQDRWHRPDQHALSDARRGVKTHLIELLYTIALQGADTLVSQFFEIIPINRAPTRCRVSCLSRSPALSRRAALGTGWLSPTTSSKPTAALSSYTLTKPTAALSSYTLTKHTGGASRSRCRDATPSSTQLRINTKHLR